MRKRFWIWLRNRLDRATSWIYWNKIASPFPQERKMSMPSRESLGLPPICECRLDGAVPIVDRPGFVRAIITTNGCTFHRRER